MDKIFLTGGTGRLGRELQKYLDCVAPTRAEMDIVDNPWIDKECAAIVHCAAYTDVDGCERDPDKAQAVNITGTRNIADLALKHNKPLIYISTEYVFDGRKGQYREDDERKPVNVYAQTKSLGEDVARYAPRSLVVRLVLKERPWKYPAAFVDQYTSGDYVDRIAPIVAEVVNKRNKFRRHDIIHIGTGRKSIFELAKRTRNVNPMLRLDIKTPLPYDTSLDTTKWEIIRAR